MRKKWQNTKQNKSEIEEYYPNGSHLKNVYDNYEKKSGNGKCKNKSVFVNL